MQHTLCDWSRFEFAIGRKRQETVGGVHVGLSICIYLKMKLYHFFVRP